VSDWEYDLVVLVPDKNMEWALHGLLSRPEALRIRSVRFIIRTHLGRDPGCARDGHNFLRPMSRTCHHALIMFDHEGCGREGEQPQALEDEVALNLSSNGWGDRAKALILSPELEIWVWSDSPEVDRCLGWQLRTPDLRTWLKAKGFWAQGAEKPAEPKSAVEASLREVKKPRSSSIYKQIAQSVSLRRCTDVGFRRFSSTLQSWFPENRQ
jgi:hypothetical protein